MPVAPCLASPQGSSAPSDVGSVQLCLLDGSVARASTVDWVGRLPYQRVMMIAEQVLEPTGFMTPGRVTARARRIFKELQRRDLKLRFAEVDLHSGADPVLDQIWRLGPQLRLMLVTANPNQAAGAQNLLALNEKLPAYQAHLAPVQKGLLVVRPTPALPLWEPVTLAVPPPPVQERVRHASEERLRRGQPLFRRFVGQVPSVDQSPLPTPEVTTGTILKGSAGGARRLVSTRIRGGGEGDIYFTDTGEVCKIYKPQRATQATVRKLKLMVRQPLGHPLVCWPSDIALTGDNVFAGYFMPRAPGQTLIEVVTDTVGLRTSHPDWTRVDLARLAMKICEVVAYLHDNNVILGDLNDGNIMVDSAGTPWFIDTDSFQIGQFPSPVARLPFVHPDLMGGAGVANAVRLPQHDRFALAALIFKILFIGSSPYAATAPECEEQQHRDRVFPFRIKGQGDPRLSRDERPLGCAPFIWSQLPTYLREAFWQVFRECKEADMAPRTWQGLLERYVTDLETGKASNELLPTRFRDPPPPGHGEERRQCKHCGHPFNTAVGSTGFWKNYCPTCRRRTKPQPCSRTGCRKQVYVEIPLLDRSGPLTCNFHKLHP